MHDSQPFVPIPYSLLPIPCLSPRHQLELFYGYLGAAGVVGVVGEEHYGDLVEAAEFR